MYGCHICFFQEYGTLLWGREKINNAKLASSVDNSLSMRLLIQSGPWDLLNFRVFNIYFTLLKEVFVKKVLPFLCYS